MKPNYGLKGKEVKGQIRDPTRSKQHASSSKNPFRANTNYSSFCSPQLSFTDGSFKFTSEPRKEVGITQARNGLAQPQPSKSLEILLPTNREQCKDGNTSIDSHRVATNGATMVDVQVRYPRKDRDICGSMEKCVAAFVGASIHHGGCWNSAQSLSR
ncbi:hypothetical protein CMV_006448 [Castanea mollissima]|uniref:Uncharacterized protein n=1 Tax=Castanea mollissima TaxID=60419 RepID=A0A8J4RVJ4_9ROSI|nr:hypothetical protein CMV_006448 [Castanea mollissima]